MRIGVDIVEVARLGRALERFPALAARLFTCEELRIADIYKGSRRNEFLAGRLATKEAVLKAIQLGIGELGWLTGIEVLRDTNGGPTLNLSGAISDIAAANGLRDWQVSISHEAGLATAFVLLS